MFKLLLIVALSSSNPPSKLDNNTSSESALCKDLLQIYDDAVRHTKKGTSYQALITYTVENFQGDFETFKFIKNTIDLAIDDYKSNNEVKGREKYKDYCGKLIDNHILEEKNIIEQEKSNEDRSYEKYPDKLLT